MHVSVLLYPHYFRHFLTKLSDKITLSWLLTLMRKFVPSVIYSDMVSAESKKKCSSTSCKLCHIDHPNYIADSRRFLHALKVLVPRDSSYTDNPSTYEKFFFSDRVINYVPFSRR